MEKYRFLKQEIETIESLQIAFAIYQFVDRRVVTLALSDGFCELFGYEDRGQAYFDMDNDMYKDTHPDDVARIADAAFYFATKGGAFEVIYRTKQRRGSNYRVIHAMGKHVYKDGVRMAHVWYMDEGNYVPDEASPGKSIELPFNKALHEESLLKASYYDYLTGLPSMTYFFELAEEGRRKYLAQGEKPALLFVDLSGMKFFNRKYGFSAGDELLRCVSKILVRHFSNENCSRFGQDHFAVFTKEEGLKETLAQVLRECKEVNGGNSLPIRIGIYLDMMDAVDISTACDRAKIACDAIRNSFASGIRYYNEELRDDMERNRYILANLDRALEEKWIKVYYQPIVRAVNGRVCDEEALSRWIDPVKGFLSPAEFIPTLEDAGVIYKLDLFVLDEVLRKLKVQEQKGLFMVPQSINLSRYDFDACDIVEEIRTRVDGAGLSRNLITIEITESVLGKDFDFMKQQILKFQGLGFPVWMDDFGSGYSSLEVLKDVPFDLVKLDMGFMQGLNQGEKGKVILTELVKMCTALNIDTVCEGVETQEQVRFLQEIGCSKLQGYFYTKPIPEEMVFERYEKGIQIGFENPEEAVYYETIGSVNLYDLGMVANDDNGFIQFFDTIPMSIMEMKEDKIRFVRSNQSYRDFAQHYYGFDVASHREDYRDLKKKDLYSLMTAIHQCCKSGKRLFFDEQMPDGTNVHALVRRISVNPVNQTTALALAILSVRDVAEGMTYASIARALATDYSNIYYVDMKTEHFIEYSSPMGEERLAMERHGEGFFSASRQDALQRVYKEDQELFLASFNRENICKELKENGVFRFTYRLVDSGKPVYHSMKCMKLQSKGDKIIIGVTNIDLLMQQKEALARIHQEQVAYGRIMALSRDYICLYTVDLATGAYMEFSSTSDYAGLKLAKSGKDFFQESQENALTRIEAQDLVRYQKVFTRENILENISRKGMFKLKYTLKMQEGLVQVSLRAAMVKEGEQEKLIVGVSRTGESS